MNPENLQAGGIRYEEGLKRFANKSQLYEKYLIAFLSDPTFAQLEPCLTAKDYDEAFKIAHTLKGMVGNLSMTGLYASDCALVEALRHQQTEQVDALYRDLKLEYLRVIGVIQSELPNE